MNHEELARFEAELRGTAPAAPPAGFLQRLTSEVPTLVAERRMQAAPATQPPRPETPVAPAAVQAAEASPWPFGLRFVLRLLVPATALLAVGTILWRAHLPAPRPAQTASAPVRADDVQIDQQLVSTFDTVATLPNGEPVRFRCREWMDEVVLRDTRLGVEVARRVPRVEVVPVRFETY